MRQKFLEVISQKQLAPRIYEIVVCGELVKEIRQPGQFLNLRPERSDLLLRRPISISSYDKKAQTATMIYRVEGAGTADFAALQAGDTLDALEPLGSGFPVAEIQPGEKIFIIGGGIGIPPLYQVAKMAAERGAEVHQFLGFASADVMYYQNEFAKISAHTYFATDDGSFGHRGNVIELVNDILPKVKPDAVYACGAKGMLQRVDEIFAKHPRAFVSLEARMACGVGACYGCVTHVVGDETGSSSRRVCKEGPVFPTGEVII